MQSRTGAFGHGKGTYHEQGQVGKEARLILGPVRHPQDRLTLKQGAESWGRFSVPLA